MDSSNVKSLSDQEIQDLLHKDILSLLGLEGIDEAKKKEFQDNATEAIENRVFARVMEILREKSKVEEYDKAPDVDKFLEENKIDVDRLFIEEALFYKLQLQSYAKVVDDGLIKLAQSKKEGKKGTE